jgi:hypothetical protein
VPRTLLRRLGRAAPSFSSEKETIDGLMRPDVAAGMSSSLLAVTALAFDGFFIAVFLPTSTWSRR